MKESEQTESVIRKPFFTDLIGEVKLWTTSGITLMVADGNL